MRPEFVKRLLLVLPVVLVAGCGGGGTSSPTASSPVASTHSDPSTPAPSTPDSTALRDVVCKALAEIATDMKSVPYKPEAVLAQFTLKVSGYATSAANVSSLVANADTVAQAGCPADRTAVLAAAGQGTLDDLLK